jgi:hypothetical protein
VLAVSGEEEEEEEGRRRYCAGREKSGLMVPVLDALDAELESDRNGDGGGSDPSSYTSSSSSSSLNAVRSDSGCVVGIGGDCGRCWSFDLRKDLRRSLIVAVAFSGWYVWWGELRWADQV